MDNSHTHTGTVNLLKCSRPNNLIEINEMFNTIYNSDVLDCANDHTQGNSYEDRLWLNKVESSIKLRDGHYEIPLPFRDNGVELPSNKWQVLKHIGHLKNKFIKSSMFTKKSILNSWTI